MNTYYADKPVKDCSADLLDRASFAKLLSNTLLNLNGDDTFTIGLFGKWGNGKTSIVNMALTEIENDVSKNNVLIVKFEPWHFSDSSQLLSQFFVRLSSEFKSKKDKKLQKIGSAIEKYSNAFDLAKLIPVYGDTISTAAKFGAGKIAKRLQKDISSSDVIAQKNEVIELLKQQKNRVLVIIDDIDRLSSEQIRLVFQLVSSVAKFPNTAYLLVFDKNIVVKALEKVQEGNGEDYLEKVIQMPIQIPEIPKEKLHSVLFNRLDEMLSSYPQTLFVEEHWSEIFKSCVAPFVSNLRDINRLCNTLRFKMTTISSEVDFADMVAISTIENGFPRIYEWIKSHKNSLTGTDGFQAFEAKKKTEAEWLAIYREQFKLLLVQEGKAGNEVEVKTIATALAILFPHFGQKIGENYVTLDMDTWRRKNFIAHPEKFDRYFHYDIDKVFLTRSELDKAILQSSPEEFISFLVEKDRENQGMATLQEIKSMITEIPPARAKLLFGVLVLSADKLKTIDKSSMLSVGASVYCEHLCLDLLERVNSLERKELLNDVLLEAELADINSLATLINIMELSYGRLAAKGVEHHYKKVISVGELEEIEKAFTERIKKLLENANLFDCLDWRMTLYLLETFDEEYAENYLKTVFEENQNILAYLWRSVSIWIGAGNSYEVNDHYKKYLSSQDVLNAIKEEVISKRIFTMKEDIVCRSAAFYLDSLGYKGWNLHISQDSVDKVISYWKENGFELAPDVFD